MVTTKTIHEKRSKLVSSIDVEQADSVK